MAKARDDWGEKYQDECFKFEREWKKIVEERDEEQDRVLKEEMTEAQRKMVDMIVDKMVYLNVFELRYLALSLKRRIGRSTGINPLKLNMDWPSIK